MSQLHDFLTWFDGWAENISKTPNAKQWSRLKGKVAEMRSAPAEQARPAPVSVAANADPDPDARPSKSKPKAWTKQSWEKAFISELEKEGWDAESAKEIMAGMTFNPNLDPSFAAKQAAAGQQLN